MKNKILKYLDLTLIIISILVSLYFVFSRDKEIGLVLKDLSIILTITLPLWVEKLFKVKINIVTKTYIIVFIFMAHFLGAICEFYNKIQGFDKLTHWLSGMLTAYIAILLLQHLKKCNKKHKKFTIIFMIFTTLAVASMWEMFEFTANLLFGGDAQKVASTGVTDTMLDMIVAFLGSIIYSLIYWFNKE